MSNDDSNKQKVIEFIISEQKKNLTTCMCNDDGKFAGKDAYLFASNKQLPGTELLLQLEMDGTQIQLVQRDVDVEEDDRRSILKILISEQAMLAEDTRHFGSSSRKKQDLNTNYAEWPHPDELLNGLEYMETGILLALTPQQPTASKYLKELQTQMAASGCKPRPVLDIGKKFKELHTVWLKEKTLKSLGYSKIATSRMDKVMDEITSDERGAKKFTGLLPISLVKDNWSDSRLEYNDARRKKAVLYGKGGIYNQSAALLETHTYEVSKGFNTMAEGHIKMANTDEKLISLLEKQENFVEQGELMVNVEFTDEDPTEYQQYSFKIDAKCVDLKNEIKQSTGKDVTLWKETLIRKEIIITNCVDSRALFPAQEFPRRQLRDCSTPLFEARYIIPVNAAKNKDST